jgi:hypothetical protein
VLVAVYSRGDVYGYLEQFYRSIKKDYFCLVAFWVIPLTAWTVLVIAFFKLVTVNKNLVN